MLGIYLMFEHINILRGMCMKLGSFVNLALLLLVIGVPIAGAENAAGKISLTSPVTATGLEGVSWSLDSYLSPEGQTENVLNYTEITALFESGRVSGNGGCNNYAGSYVTEGNNINISQLLSTMMFCGDNISAQESNYLMNLQKAATYSISDNLLKMSDANGTVTLTYSVVEPLPLVGTNWSMLNYNNGREAVVGALAGTEVTAIFGADGNLTGTAGCNNYRAGFKVDGNNITIELAATTQMFCAEPEGIMDQEAAYLRAIENAATYKIDRQQLWLRYENDSIAAIFENAAAI
jgi:heat shock protein HslJ